MLYEEIEKMVQEMLPVKKDLDGDDNLLNAGLDSLKIMRIVNDLRKDGIRASYGSLLDEPTLKSWEKIINSSSKRKIRRESKRVSDKDEFDLTDVQYAYKIGREDEQELGGVGCHAFMEFEGKEIDVEKLNSAWKKVQYHHPMLRARFTENGKQVVMDSPYNEQIDLYDFSKDPDCYLKAEELKEKISHRRFEIEKGHVCVITLILLPQGRFRLFYDVDLLIADVQSFGIILKDLADAYLGKELPADSAKWNFADYLKRKEIEEKEDFLLDRAYWQERISEMPHGPELPLLQSPAEIKTTHVKRYTVNVSKDIWNDILKRIADEGVTPAVYLMTVYAFIIGSRSTNKRFLINIPTFDRHKEYGSTETAVADFTTLMLLEADLSDDPTFKQMVSRISARLHEDMRHNAYSGVQIQRDIIKQQGETKAIAPVVFACNFGNPVINDDFEEIFGEFKSMVSQTPGVWIDFQSYETPKDIMLTWDCVEGLFPEGLIEDMMQSMENLIHETAKEDWDKHFDMLPQNQRDFTEKQKNIAYDISDDRLFDDFLENAKKYPDKTAVLDTDEGLEISYEELRKRALSVAGFFIDRGISGEAVAVTLKRGYRQSAAVLGILMSGNLYVPVSMAQPASRRQIIHKRMGINHVISQKGVSDSVKWPENASVSDIEDLFGLTPAKGPVSVRSTDPAYIIMTSGTTGEPKGVEITHAGALNTIRDVNSRYNIKEDAVALGISAMDFDLSVYDFFGITCAGGTLITISDDSTRDAGRWMELILKFNVNTWNSVPVLLEMLIIEAEAEGARLPLKTVMLSGDWIGLDIPERVEALTEGCHIYAMGGATEASIWSNWFEVKTPLPEEWHSIPYGRPLSGQSYRITDENGNDVPFLCEGELLIGGAGVGTYRGDSELVRKKFTEDNGVRWYKTGDKGRFWNDGTIEFLGRKDFQVKIRGHRIELGEIEAAIKKINGIKTAAVEVSDTGTGDKHLVAYLESDGVKNAPLFKRDDKLVLLSKKIKDIINAPQEVQEDASDYEATMDFARKKQANMLLKYFVQNGIFTDDKAWSVNDISDSIMITDEYKGLLERFLIFLAGNGILETVEGKYLKCSAQNISSRPACDVQKRTESYISRVGEYLDVILRGEKQAADIYYHPEHELSPGDLFNLIPGTEAAIKSFACRIKDIVKAHDGKVNVAEIGTRNIKATQILAEELKDEDIKYVYYDNSAYFTDKTAALKEKYDFFESGICDIEEGAYPDDSFDIVIALNFVHRTKKSEDAVKNLKGMLSPAGVLCVFEMLERSFLQDISAAVIEKGNDKLFSLDMCEKLISDAGFDIITRAFEKNINGMNALFALSTESMLFPDREYITQTISEDLPEYMIPKVFCCLEKLPLSANGKVDRKKLKKMASGSPKEKEKIQARTETEKNLCDIWKEIFDTEVGINDNYYRLGGDSLTAIKMTTKIKALYGINYTVKNAMNDITVEKQAKTVEKLISEGNTDSLQDEVNVKANPEAVSEPFPLTEVQNAYLMGRSGEFTLGDVSTHVYFELDADVLDADRAERALNEMIRKHGAMRLVFTKDGMQKILPEVPDYKMKRYDFKKLDVDDTDKNMLDIREEMSEQVADIFTWPIFDIRIADTGRKNRIFVSFDNIVFDGFSMFGIFTEWAQRYRGEFKEKTNSDFTYRDYVIGLEKIKETRKFDEDKKYWLDRLDGFAPAPAFPLRISESEIKKQKFERHSAFLEKRKWESLKENAAKHGVTPTAMLITAYAEVIRTRSAMSEFTLNLTQFDKKPIHPDINEILGDFTTLTLLEMIPGKSESFLERTKNTMERLGEDLEHSYYSAVDFERELRNSTQNITGSIMPVVFTSGIGVSSWNSGDWLGELTYNVSQTPQVWLDHQVVERDGGIGLFWDSLKEIFYPGFIDEMFKDYICLLNKLSEDAACFETKCSNLVQVEPGAERMKANDTDHEFEEGTLDSVFMEAADKYPSNTAIVCGDERLSYSDVKKKALYISMKLADKKIKEGEPVAIYAPKGSEQIIAALGVLLAGGAYLPLDVSNPDERLEKIIKDSKSRFVLIGSGVSKPDIKADCEFISLEKAKRLTEGNDVRQAVNKDPDSLAYVIYTSGSTGTPKGVMISHSGALNTIQDINERFEINEKDTCMAISNMHFDLSVFDIFGLLSKGGKIVIPTPGYEKDPAHWAELINKENITIWNSVPAFVEMLCEYNSLAKKIKKDSLRLMLLSGDWINTKLPETVEDQFGKVRFVALGGATEASIWSNIFEVSGEVPKDWSSIPYGKPLKNQKYYILDENLNHRPDWVPGQIFIAGKGVALGYINDEKKTRERFIIHPETGEYMYNTGDMGRYWSDGNIEFLGRADKQIKINGYRVEIGEIENALNREDAVSEGKIIFKDNILIAFFKYEGKYTKENNERLKENLRLSLPRYMVPAKLIAIDEYPLTSNGKIDFTGLYNMSLEHDIPGVGEYQRHPETEDECALAKIWGRVLKYTNVYAEDDFFSKGGDSLKAIHLTNAIRNEMQVEIEVKDLFAHGSLSKIAGKISEKKKKAAVGCETADEFEI